METNITVQNSIAELNKSYARADENATWLLIPWRDLCVLLGIMCILPSTCAIALSLYGVNLKFDLYRIAIAPIMFFFHLLCLHLLPRYKSGIIIGRIEAIVISVCTINILFATIAVILSAHGLNLKFDLYRVTSGFIMFMVCLLCLHFLQRHKSGTTTNRITLSVISTCTLIGIFTASAMVISLYAFDVKFYLLNIVISAIIYSVCILCLFPPRFRAGIRISRIAAIVISVCALIMMFKMNEVSYFSLKSVISFINPNNYDPIFESIERFIFLGTTPSLWLIQRIEGVALITLEICYHSFFPFLLISTTMAVVYGGMREGVRLCFMLFLGLYLCLIMALWFPSRGPIFMHPEYFIKLSHLPTGMLAKHLLSTVDISANKTIIFPAVAGIAAMPSYHVYAWACATLWWKRFPRPLFGALIILFFFNWFSTVILGWHYFIDGVVAVLLVLPIWLLANLIMPPRDSVNGH